MTGRVSQIGYIELETGNMASWLELSRHIGFEIVNSPRHGIGLRVDSDRWSRICLREGSADRLTAVGWEAASEQDFAAICERLHHAGVNVESRPDLASRRNVGELVRFEAPDEIVCELYHAPRTMIRAPFRSPEHVAFVAGAMGMGHVTLAVSDIAAAVGFYRDVLGLRLTEVADVGDLSVTFLRAGIRHHSLALAQMPTGEAGVDHVMIEVATLDDLGAIRDRMFRAGHRLRRDLGRHPTDGVISMYLETPASFELEVGWGSIQVNEQTWEVDRHARSAFSWGHRPPGTAEGELGVT